MFQLLDKALDQLRDRHTGEFAIFVAKLGQKDTSHIETSQITEISDDDSVTVHVGVTFWSLDPGYTLTWSRYGIQEMVLSKGTLYPCLGFRDLGNYRSAVGLDPPPDVSREITDLVKFGKPLFITMYSKSPHRKAEQVHPVTSALIGRGIFHNKVSQLFKLYLDWVKKGIERQFSTWFFPLGRQRQHI